MSRRFHWIVQDAVAGMELPGSIDRELDDFMFLIKQGVDTIVTLTEDPLPRTSHLTRRFDLVHFPIDDFGVPELEPTIALTKDIRRRVRQGRKVVFHCWAGLGRTGTLLACYLVLTTGQPASGVIPWLRSFESGYVQTDDQELFIEEFAANISLAADTDE